MAKNTKLYFIIGIVVVIALMSPKKTALVCYQEDATSSNVCGGLATGSYDFDNQLNDNNWLTFRTTPATVRTEHYQYTYTKPPQAVGAEIRTDVRFPGFAPHNTNLVIPSECWNINPTYIQMDIILARVGTSPHRAVVEYQCEARETVITGGSSDKACMVEVNPPGCSAACQAAGYDDGSTATNCGCGSGICCSCNSGGTSQDNFYWKTLLSTYQNADDTTGQVYDEAIYWQLPDVTYTHFESFKDNFVSTPTSFNGFITDANKWVQTT